MFKRIVDFNCPSLTFGGTKLIGKVCPSAFGVSIFLLLLPEIEYHLTLWLCIILTTRIFGIEAANCRIIQQVNQDVSSDVTQSRKDIGGSIILPGKDNPSDIAGYVMGINGDNFNNDDSLNLIVLFTLEYNTSCQEPTPTSIFFTCLCQNSHLPASIVDQLRSKNKLWTQNWKVRKDWSYNSPKTFKTKKAEATDKCHDTLRITDGPKPFKHWACNKALIDNLESGLVMYKSRTNSNTGVKHEYRLIVGHPFLFSVSKEPKCVYIIMREEGSSHYVLKRSKNIDHRRIVMNIAETRRFSLSEKVQSSKIYNTIKTAFFDCEGTKASSYEMCLQYALCNMLKIGNEIGFLA